MINVAESLAVSRRAHLAGKQHLAAGQRAEARAQFQLALDARLAAREADPGHDHLSWLEDALHPVIQGEKKRRYMRIPGLTLAEVAAKQDADLETYYRYQTGELANPVTVVENPEIVTPKAWQVTKAGAVNLDGSSPCAAGHRMQLLTFDQRTCTGCGRVEQLIEVKDVKDTDAFKQLTKEQEGRA